MHEWGKATRQTRDEMRELRREAEETEKAARRARSEARKEALKDKAGGDIDAISNTISGFETMEELSKWAQQKSPVVSGGAVLGNFTNFQRMLGTAPGGSQYSNAMNRYAKDLYFQKLNELSSAKTTASGGSTQPTKMMTVNLKAGGQTTAVSVPENDMGKLLETLKNAGLVTA